MTMIMLWIVFVIALFLIFWAAIGDDDDDAGLA